MSVAQLIGRRLGRKTFQKLELGRGFCTSDQLFRLIQSKGLNELDSEDIKAKIKSSKRLTSEDLANAGAEQMEGFLPQLDKTLDVYRASSSVASLTKLWPLIMMLVFTAMTARFYEEASSVLHCITLSPFLLFAATAGLLYSHSVTGCKAKKHFLAWKKVWPTNLLIPGTCFNLYFLLADKHTLL